MQLVLFAVSKMYDYQVYALWLLIPSILGLVVFGVGSIVVCICAGGSIIGVIKFLLGDIIKERDEEDDDERQYYIQDQPLKGGFLMAVMIAAFQFVICALMTFWYKFLVDVTYSCDSNLDCYPFPVGFSTAIPQNIPPIVNCSDYEILPDNTTIVCLTFTFDYPRAIGEAGGVLAFAVLGIRVMIGIVVWLQSKGRVRWAYVLMFVLCLVYMIGVLLVYLLGTLVPVFRPLVVGPPKQMQFWVYSMTFLFGFIFIPLAYLFQSIRLFDDDD